MDIRNAINVLRRGQPPRPLPGYTQESVNEAWQALFYFLEQHLSQIVEMDGIDAEEEKID